MELHPIDLHYEEHGQGFPVVLLHGFPLDRSIWYPIVPLLKDTARLILPDLRGHGQSPAPDGTYDMRTMAEDVCSLLKRLEIEQAVIVGHSMGGYVALAFAHAYPCRVAGLGLVASRIAADSPEKRQSRISEARTIRRHGLNGMARKMPSKLTHHAEIAEKTAQLIQKTSPTGVIGALKGMAEREDASEWVRRMRFPTLVVAGQEDAIVPIDEARTYVDFFPRGWLVEVLNGSHMVMMEHPEQVATALLQLVHYAKEADCASE